MSRGVGQVFSILSSSFDAAVAGFDFFSGQLFGKSAFAKKLSFTRGQ